MPEWKNRLYHEVLLKSTIFNYCLYLFIAVLSVLVQRWSLWWVLPVYLLLKSFGMVYMLRWAFSCCMGPVNFVTRNVVVLLIAVLCVSFGLVWLIDALLPLLWIQSALFYMQTCQILFYTSPLIVGKSNEYFGCEMRSLQVCMCLGQGFCW